MRDAGWRGNRLRPYRIAIRGSNVTFEPCKGALLSVEKLAPIESFMDDDCRELNSRRHRADPATRQPVYLKAFGQRDGNAGVPMTLDAIPNHSVRPLLAPPRRCWWIGARSRLPTRQQIHPVLRQDQGRVS
jgi:hypothetical protein